MYAKMKFTIPEEGDVTLTVEIAGMMESSSGTKILTFANKIRWWGEEGAEAFLGVEMQGSGTNLVIEETGCYRLTSLEFVHEIDLPQ